MAEIKAAVAQQIISVIKEQDEDESVRLDELTKDQDVSYRDELGYTFLHYAAQYDRGWAVDFLLEKQKKTAPDKLQDYIDMQTNDIETTALGIATTLQYKDIFTSLVKFGADPNIPDKHGMTAVYDATEDLDMFKLIENQVDLHKTSSDGSTLMHYAAARFFNTHNWAVVEYLLNIPGIEYNKQNNQGMTPKDILRGLDGYHETFDELVGKTPEYQIDQI
jgi:ankyrin repeat protein